jgi:hypothetical protein
MACAGFDCAKSAELNPRDWETRSATRGNDDLTAEIGPRLRVASNPGQTVSGWPRPHGSFLPHGPFMVGVAERRVGLSLGDESVVARRLVVAPILTPRGRPGFSMISMSARLLSAKTCRPLDLRELSEHVEGTETVSFQRRDRVPSPWERKQPRIL